MKFHIAANYNRDVTRFELVVGRRLPKCCGMGYERIPFKVLENLFRNKDGSYDFHSDDMNRWLEITTIEEVNGRMIFSCDTRKLRNKLGGLNIDVIKYTLPCRLGFRHGEKIGTAIQFPSIGSWQDAVDACDALHKVNDSWYDISNRVYEERLSRQKTEITRLKKFISEYESKIQEICGDAADSLNLLEEKYGISVKM